MGGHLTEELTPPQDLRPAQLGIILVGRVVVGHIGATLIDLCQRRFLRIEDAPDGADAQWMLTDRRSQAPGPGVPLLPFETVLLDGLFRSQPQVRLPQAGAALLPVIDQVRAELRRDAVRDGRLRRWRQDRRTERGEQLLRQIQGFRRVLRGRVLSGAGVPAALAPYMMPALWRPAGRPFPGRRLDAAAEAAASLAPRAGGCSPTGTCIIRTCWPGSVIDWLSLVGGP